MLRIVVVNARLYHLFFFSLGNCGRGEDEGGAARTGCAYLLGNSNDRKASCCLFCSDVENRRLPQGWLRGEQTIFLVIKTFVCSQSQRQLIYALHLLSMVIYSH